MIKVPTIMPRAIPAARRRVLFPVEAACSHWPCTVYSIAWYRDPPGISGMVEGTRNMVAGVFYSRARISA